MIVKFCAAWVLVAVFLVTGATAADVKHKFSIQQALELEQVKRKLAGNVAFYWGKQPYPAPLATFGTYKASRRVGKDQMDISTACALAMAEAVVSLRDEAERQGGNSVVGIVSNLKDEMESSESEYSCMVGRMLVNVALKGTAVTLKK
jgi:uncharacterized protein YbjQ (UPF0145 family)